MTDITHQISNEKGKHGLDSCQLETDLHEQLGFGILLLNVKNFLRIQGHSSDKVTLRP